MAYLQESQVRETLSILMRSYKMTASYEVIENIDGTQIIKRMNQDGSISFIPKDEGNADYQEYLNPKKPNEASTL